MELKNITNIRIWDDEDAWWSCTYKGTDVMFPMTKPWFIAAGWVFWDQYGPSKKIIIKLPNGQPYDLSVSSNYATNDPEILWVASRLRNMWDDGSYYEIPIGKPFIIPEGSTDFNTFKELFPTDWKED